MGNITTSEELNVGHIYYLVSYEDRDSKSPMVTTLRYKRVDETSTGRILHIFSKCVIDRDDEDMFIPADLLDGTIFDADGLIKILEE